MAKKTLIIIKTNNDLLGEGLIDAHYARSFVQIDGLTYQVNGVTFPAKPEYKTCATLVHIPSSEDSPSKQPEPRKKRVRNLKLGPSP